MANICSIDIWIPLEKIPDDEEKQQYTALHKAWNEWEKRPATNEKMAGVVQKNFLSSQPGVPFKKTELGNIPTIHASFTKRDKKIWVLPDESLTIKPFKDMITHLNLICSFKHGFPWWAQVGFAGATKIFNKKPQKDGDSTPYLRWELKVESVLKNLEFVIRTYEEFPVSGKFWQWSWIWEELPNLSKIYEWFKVADKTVPEAIAVLNWEEVAMYSMSHADTKNNDYPNRLMNGVKEIAQDIEDFSKGLITRAKFQKKYAIKLRNVKGKKGYEPITEREVFEG